jgi:hypothetical protein
MESHGEPRGVTVAAFSLGDPSIAQVDFKNGSKKAPPKRTTTALADFKPAPEPR